jgi:hypothetical protein
MVVLMGSVSLAIDGGRMFAERRDAQGAADHAAMTASFGACSGKGTSQAIAAGLASAASNGFNNNGTTNWVTITRLAGNRFKAAVRASMPATFARVMGFSNLGVAVEAEADCTGGFGPTHGAVFAGGDTCNASGKYPFQTSGGGQRVSGGVHSNGDVAIGSKPNWWTDDGNADPFTYAGNLVTDYAAMSHDYYPTPCIDCNVFEQAASAPAYPEQDAWIDWPADYSPGDVGPRLAYYEALATASGADNLFYIDGDLTALTTSGLYYVTGRVDIGTVSGNLDVTLVSEQDIKLSASTWTLSPFMDNLLAFSALAKTGDKVCDEFTVAMSGSNVQWNGVVWAPLGLAEFSGSGNTTLDGSIISWAVRLNGSALNLNHTVPEPGEPGLVYLYH